MKRYGGGVSILSKTFKRNTSFFGMLCKGFSVILDCHRLKNTIFKTVDIRCVLSESYGQ